jgi:O-antigen ligase
MTKAATVIFAIWICTLFALNRDRQARTSPALWIPVFWLLIAGSRMLSNWLYLQPPDSGADAYLDGSPLDRNFLTALLVAGVIVLIRRGPKVAALLQANGAIALFFLYCALSIFWSDFPDVAFKRWIKSFGDLVMVLVVFSEADGLSALKRVLSRTAFFLVPLSILFIKYYPDLGRTYSRWTWQPSWTGVTTDKNMLGMTCLVFGLASAWRLLSAIKEPKSPSRMRLLVAHGAVVAMTLWLLEKCNSMTSLSCFLLGTGLMVAMRSRFVSRRPAAAHLLVFGVLSTAFAVLFLDLGSAVLSTMGRDPTLTGRTDLWRHVLEMNQNSFIGTGFASFWLGPRLQALWRIYWWEPTEAHNGYLEIFLNLGWVGVVLFAILLVTAYRNATRLLKRDPETGSLVLAYFVVGLAYNFTEAAFKTMNLIWIAFMLAVVASSRVFARPSPEPEEAEASPWDLPAAEAEEEEQVFA